MIKICEGFRYAKIFSHDTVGSNNNATYSIDFITGHKVPYHGAVSVYLP